MRLEKVSRSKEMIGTKRKMFQNPKWLTQSNKSHIYYKVETLTVIAVTKQNYQQAVRKLLWCQIPNTEALSLNEGLIHKPKKEFIKFSQKLLRITEMKSC